MNLIKYKGLDINPAHLHETVTVKTEKPKSLQMVEQTGGGEYLLPRIEAIHAGATRNYNHYLAERLKGDPGKKSGVYSWMQPYAKPVIFNHDTDTQVTGRILHAAYADYTQAGRPGIVLIPKITEPHAVEALRAGRLLTVSVGATTDAAICSICGTDILNEGYCGHMKGETYEGRVCEWIAGDLWFDELSWVNVPADQDAMVVDTESSVFLDTPQEAHASSKESSATRSLSEWFGIPKGVPLTIASLQEESEQKPAENQGQEESEGMDNETEKTVPETEAIVVEPTTEEPVVPEEQMEEPVASDGTPEEAPEETPEVPAEPEDEPVVPENETNESLDVQANAITTGTIEASTILAGELPSVVEVEGLRRQVEALTAEMKDLFIERIAAKEKVQPERKEAYANRLKERTLDSLRDKWMDLEEAFEEPEELVEKPVSRTVTKVASPVPSNKENVKEEKTITEQDVINSLKSLLGS